MGIAGNLKTMALAELLQWLSLGGKTGALEISRRGVQKRVYFQDGKIISTSSNDEHEYLGHFLVAQGYITEDELKMAMEVQEESSILLGKILVMINAISETDLLRLMRRKAEESIYDVFLWSEGDFEFKDGEAAEQKMIPLSLDVTGIVMEGLHRYDEWKRIREAIPSALAIPQIVKAMPPAGISDADRYILARINGEHSIAEIAVNTHNSEFAVMRLVYRGMRNESITLADRHADRSSRSTGTTIIDDADNLMRRGRAMEKQNPETAWRIYKAAAELDPSDGRPRDALRRTEETLKVRLAKAGIEPHRVPVLKIAISEVAERSLTPNEGFILSRINGTWDINSIVKISPIREMEVLLAFHKLAQAGIIEFKPGK